MTQGKPCTSRCPILPLASASSSSGKQQPPRGASVSGLRDSAAARSRWAKCHPLLGHGASRSFPGRWVSRRPRAREAQGGEHRVIAAPTLPARRWQQTFPASGCSQRARALAAIRLSRSPIGPGNRVGQKEQAHGEAEGDPGQPQELGSRATSFKKLMKTQSWKRRVFQQGVWTILHVLPF